ncbi:Cof-type HAD-IIB family hydrolase [Draconibacterium sp.]|jgi:Cof subfamily protein (haloacid dehalogenase superfamily)
MKNGLKNIRLVATDLDGTFLKDDRSVSQNNLEALHLLGKNNITRVAATGRNLKKVQEVLTAEMPFDYIVYSSGAGIFDWKHKKQVTFQNIGKHSVRKLVDTFIGKNYNFHAFFPAPENHKHWYHRGGKVCDEFERYFSFNNGHASELQALSFPETELCQFLVIIPEDENNFQQFKSEIEAVCADIRVIRSSSPITKGFIWVEIFHHSVSKGNGVKHICNLLDIKPSETLGIGNDYNDFDLLAFTGHSYLTENAPHEIKHLYPNVLSNENDAFAFTIQSIVQ